MRQTVKIQHLQKVMVLIVIFCFFAQTPAFGNDRSNAIQDKAYAEYETIVVDSQVIDRITSEVSPISSYDTRFYPAIALAVQENQKKSWVKRNPVLFGALLGFGIGFGSGVALAGRNDYQTAEFGLLMGAAGAGIGALLGAVSK